MIADRALKTLIVGCGNIAGVFDYANDGLPLTHAGAYSHHGKFEVTACVDPNKIKLEKFADYWSIKNTFSQISEVIESKLNFDVISICSPTSSHYEDIIGALKLNPKLLFCEKPVSDSLHEVEEIKKLCEESDILLAVNFTRRWDPKVIELRKKIINGHLGEIRSVVGYYNKGILNNGSHMIDMLLNLFGPLEVIMSNYAVNDYFVDDPSVSALLNTSSGVPIHLVTGNASDYALFEVDIIGSKKNLTMRDGGLNWSSRSVVESKRFKGYKNLDTQKYDKGSYLEAMIGAADNIYKSVTEGRPLLCTGVEAFKVQSICKDLAEMAMSNMNSRYIK